MKFPVIFHLGPLNLHSHFALESLAYFLGYRLYAWRRRQHGDFLSLDQRLWMVAAAIIGGALGSKILNLLCNPALTIEKWNDPFYLMGGKTIVGGLIGGLFAVELAKQRLGIVRRTGDLFAVPLCVGIAIGRIGCFLSGLDDDTYGIATTLPWGVDFGDSIPRHPTQVYEIVWLVMLALWLNWRSTEPHREGDLFKGFMIGYMGFRLGVDFIKPGIPLAGLTAIQWACVGMLIYYRNDIVRLWRPREEQVV